MKLVVGLGNPGNSYNFTRHNTGFLALDFYFKTHGLEFAEKTKYSAIYHKEGDTIFVKPQTFYNDSGISVRGFQNFYKIDYGDILAICDDFNLEFGKLRFRHQGTDGGNNGLKSTIRELGTSDFPRLRVGTGNNELRRKLGDTDFVLGKFTTEEKAKLPGILREVDEKIDEFLAGKL